MIINVRMKANQRWCSCFSDISCYCFDIKDGHRLVEILNRAAIPGGQSYDPKSHEDYIY